MIPAMELASHQKLLHDLYARCGVPDPAQPYLTMHAEPAFVAAQVRAFAWYSKHLPRSGCLLDWGCMHAADACLVRQQFGDGYELHGCDMVDPSPYRPFHEFARLSYRQLAHHVELPYADGQFDAAVGSGALEHAAWDRECLKELWRCLKVGGLLAITFLPNRWSYQEWLDGLRGRPSHQRRYSRRELTSLLLHTGFRPLEVGYQARSAALAGLAGGHRLQSAIARTLQLHRLTSCICAIARKVACF